MELHLTPEQQQFVTAQAARLGAVSEDEVIKDALRFYQEREKWLAANKEWLNAAIQEGIDELDAGKGIPAEDVFRELDQRLRKSE